VAKLFTPGPADKMSQVIGSIVMLILIAGVVTGNGFLLMVGLGGIILAVIVDITGRI
jgi:hypothetical protein